jgi:hypothetical protein
MNIETLLREEIESELEKLKTMEPGSDEHKAAVDEITKLTDRAIEMKKVEAEIQDKAMTRENESSRLDAQMKMDQKDRLIKNCIAVASIVVPTAVTIWGTVKSFKFEQEGTITTIMGRGFINKLLPKK